MVEKNKKSAIKDYIKTGFFFLITGVLVLYISINVFMPEHTVKVFGFKPYVVITDSMEPVINVNDLIVVTNPKVDELVEEDIITFYADINYDGEKEVVTHYIYSINENTDGDWWIDGKDSKPLSSAFPLIYYIFGLILIFGSLHFSIYFLCFSGSALITLL